MFGFSRFNIDPRCLTVHRDSSDAGTELELPEGFRWITDLEDIQDGDGLIYCANPFFSILEQQWMKGEWQVERLLNVIAHSARFPEGVVGRVKKHQEDRESAFLIFRCDFYKKEINFRGRLITAPAGYVFINDSRYVQPGDLWSWVTNPEPTPHYLVDPARYKILVEHFNRGLIERSFLGTDLRSDGSPYNYQTGLVMRKLVDNPGAASSTEETLAREHPDIPARKCSYGTRCSNVVNHLYIFPNGDQKDVCKDHYKAMAGLFGDPRWEGARACGCGRHWVEGVDPYSFHRLFNARLAFEPTTIEAELYAGVRNVRGVGVSAPLPPPIEVDEPTGEEFTIWGPKDKL